MCSAVRRDVQTSTEHKHDATVHLKHFELLEMLWVLLATAVAAQGGLLQSILQDLQNVGEAGYVSEIETTCSSISTWYQDNLCCDTAPLNTNATFLIENICFNNEIYNCTQAIVISQSLEVETNGLAVASSITTPLTLNNTQLLSDFFDSGFDDFDLFPANIEREYELLEVNQCTLIKVEIDLTTEPSVSDLTEYYQSISAARDFIVQVKFIYEWQTDYFIEVVENTLALLPSLEQVQFENAEPPGAPPSGLNETVPLDVTSHTGLRSVSFVGYQHQQSLLTSFAATSATTFSLQLENYNGTQTINSVIEVFNKTGIEGLFLKLPFNSDFDDIDVALQPVKNESLVYFSLDLINEGATNYTFPLVPSNYHNLRYLEISGPLFLRDDIPDAYEGLTQLEALIIIAKQIQGFPDFVNVIPSLIFLELNFLQSSPVLIPSPFFQKTFFTVSLTGEIQVLVNINDPACQSGTCSFVGNSLTPGSLSYSYCVSGNGVCCGVNCLDYASLAVNTSATLLSALLSQGYSEVGNAIVIGSVIPDQIQSLAVEDTMEVNADWILDRSRFQILKSESIIRLTMTDTLTSNDSLAMALNSIPEQEPAEFVLTYPVSTPSIQSVNAVGALLQRCQSPTIFRITFEDRARDTGNQMYSIGAGCTSPFIEMKGIYDDDLMFSIYHHTPFRSSVRYFSTENHRKYMGNGIFTSLNTFLTQSQNLLYLEIRNSTILLSEPLGSTVPFKPGGYPLTHLILTDSLISNEIHSSFATKFPNLRVVHMRNCNLQGNIPTNFFSLPLLSLDLAFNDVGGTIPNGFLDQTFELMNLENTLLTGQIGTDSPLCTTVTLDCVLPDAVACIDLGPDFCDRCGGGDSVCMGGRQAFSYLSHVILTFPPSQQLKYITHLYGDETFNLRRRVTFGFDQTYTRMLALLMIDTNTARVNTYDSYDRLLDYTPNNFYLATPDSNRTVVQTALSSFRDSIYGSQPPTPKYTISLSQDDGTVKHRLFFGQPDPSVWNFNQVLSGGVLGPNSTLTTDESLSLLFDSSSNALLSKTSGAVVCDFNRTVLDLHFGDVDRDGTLDIIYFEEYQEFGERFGRLVVRLDNGSPGCPFNPDPEYEDAFATNSSLVDRIAVLFTFQEFNLGAEINYKYFFYQKNGDIMGCNTFTSNILCEQFAESTFDSEIFGVKLTDIDVGVIFRKRDSSGVIRPVVRATDDSKQDGFVTYDMTGKTILSATILKGNYEPEHTGIDGRLVFITSDNEIVVAQYDVNDGSSLYYSYYYYY